MQFQLEFVFFKIFAFVSTIIYNVDLQKFISVINIDLPLFLMYSTFLMLYLNKCKYL